MSDIAAALDTIWNASDGLLLIHYDKLRLLWMRVEKVSNGTRGISRLETSASTTCALNIESGEANNAFGTIENTDNSISQNSPCVTSLDRGIDEARQHVTASDEPPKSQGEGEKNSANKVDLDKKDGTVNEIYEAILKRLPQLLKAIDKNSWLFRSSISTQEDPRVVDFMICNGHKGKRSVEMLIQRTLCVQSLNTNFITFERSELGSSRVNYQVNKLCRPVRGKTSQFWKKQPIVNKDMAQKMIQEGTKSEVVGVLVGLPGIIPLLGLYPSWHDLPYDMLPMLIEGLLHNGLYEYAENLSDWWELSLEEYNEGQKKKVAIPRLLVKRKGCAGDKKTQQTFSRKKRKRDHSPHHQQTFQLSAPQEALNPQSYKQRPAENLNKVFDPPTLQRETRHEAIITEQSEEGIIDQEPIPIQTAETPSKPTSGHTSRSPALNSQFDCLDDNSNSHLAVAAATNASHERNSEHVQDGANQPSERRVHQQKDMPRQMRHSSSVQNPASVSSSQMNIEAPAVTLGLQELDELLVNRRPAIPVETTDHDAYPRNNSNCHGQLVMPTIQAYSDSALPTSNNELMRCTNPLNSDMLSAAGQPQRPVLPPITSILSATSLASEVYPPYPNDVFDFVADFSAPHQVGDHALPPTRIPPYHDHTSSNQCETPYQESMIAATSQPEDEGRTANAERQQDGCAGPIAEQSDEHEPALRGDMTYRVERGPFDLEAFPYLSTHQYDVRTNLGAEYNVNPIDIQKSHSFQLGQYMNPIHPDDLANPTLSEQQSFQLGQYMNPIHPDDLANPTLSEQQSFQLGQYMNPIHPDDLANPTLSEQQSFQLGQYMNPIHPDDLANPTLSEQQSFQLGQYMNPIPPENLMDPTASMPM